MDATKQQPASARDSASKPLKKPTSCSRRFEEAEPDHLRKTLKSLPQSAHRLTLLGESWKLRRLFQSKKQPARKKTRETPVKELITGYHRFEEPGYLRKLLPQSAPEVGESYRELLEEVQMHMAPNLTLWRRPPNFFPYYERSATYGCLLGDLVKDSLGVARQTWIASPSAMDLEGIVMDWFGKILSLPEEFLTRDSSGELTGGGGVLEEASSHSVYLTLLAAQRRALPKLRARYPRKSKTYILRRMVAYTSDKVDLKEMNGRVPLPKEMNVYQVQSSVIGGIIYEVLESAINRHRKIGCFPVYIYASLCYPAHRNYTDDLKRLGALARRKDMWLHVAGSETASSFVCPEFRDCMSGLELADSFEFNPYPQLITTFNYSCVWVKALDEYLASVGETSKRRVVTIGDRNLDDKHYERTLGRLLHSIKLQYILRVYGIDGLQSIYRKRCKLVQVFAGIVKKSSEVMVAHESHSHPFILIRPELGLPEVKKVFQESLPTKSQMLFEVVDWRNSRAVKCMPIALDLCREDMRDLIEPGIVAISTWKRNLPVSVLRALGLEMAD